MRDERAGANPAEEVGLSGFEFDEQSQDVQHVEKFSSVLGEPVARLDVIELRRRPSVADDGALAVQFAIAEPLNEDVFSGDLVGPDGR